MGDPCKKIEEMIKKMEKQIEWRKGDLDASSSSYKGHLKRIRILEKQVELLVLYAARGWCSGKK